MYFVGLIILATFMYLTYYFRKFWIVLFFYPLYLIKAMVIEGQPFEQTIPVLFITITVAIFFFIAIIIQNGIKETQKMEKKDVTMEVKD